MDNNIITFGLKPTQKVASLLIRLIKSISVEPVVFFNVLTFGLTVVEVPNLYIEKTCKVGSVWFGNRTFSEEVCNNIYNGSFPEEQAEVQKTVAKLEMVGRFLRNTPALFFTLFLGPWSDNFGRKFLMNLASVGNVFAMVMFILNVYFFDQFVAEFLLLENFAAFGGLYMGFYLGVYGYVSDISSEKYRTVRILLCDATFALSFTIGNLLNTSLFQALGYYGSFGFGGLCNIAVIVYNTFVLKSPEKYSAKTLGEENSLTNLQSYLSIFSLKNLSKSFMVFSQKRSNGVRHIINLLIFCYGVIILGVLGAGGLEYLYLRRAFDWTESTDDKNFLASWYTQYLSYTQAVALVSTFILLPILTNVIKMPDIGITIMASLCYTTYCLLFAFSKSRNQLYFGIPFSALTGVGTGPLRSALTKLVGPNDVGKVFAGCGALQAFAELAAPLYNLLYVNTLDTYLGAYLLMTAGMYLSQTLILVYVLAFITKLKKKTVMLEDNTQENSTSDGSQRSTKDVQLSVIKV